ncbi:VP2 [Norovirus GII/Hu/JP/2002/GII.P16_GII.17/Saitama/T87]|uniref:VP2 n=2 Tax=Norovirus GII TaxID=122929 RepID=A0A076JAG6_NORV|nr:VP2 [Norovirus GII/Hu/JP/2002/GII.P16_GII.17/Saitama/T87]
MAGAFIAGLAGDMLTNTVGSLVNAGANAITQKVDFENNKQLQAASFQHDKDMLQAQVAATKQLQADMIAIKQGILTAGGFSPTDAARGTVGAPMTKVLDWSGTRYWAPNSTRTTGYSGQFTSTPLHTPVKTSQPAPAKRTQPLSSSSGSIYSLSTQSTVLTKPSSGSSVSSASTQSTKLSSVSSMDRTADWVNQQRSLSPYMRGALNISHVTPPSSRASSSGTVSTVPKEVLDSWTPAFNTRRQPLFAHLRVRGESRV